MEDFGGVAGAAGFGEDEAAVVAVGGEAHGFEALEAGAVL